MKHLPALILILLSLSASAQFNFNVGYSAGKPLKQMADNINMLHSLSIGTGYTIPKTGGRLQAGIELTLGTYASTTKEQTFNFGNGTSTVTDVNYSSNVFQAAFNSKFLLFPTALVNPYISGKAGYATFFSNIYIEDPHDDNGCKALDQRSIIRDGSFINGYGGGVLIDFSLFKKRAQKGSSFIDISVSRNNGGEIDYINTKKLYDSGDPSATTGGKPLSVKFINATTQQIHEHQVAQVFTTPIDFLEFKISAVFKLDKYQKTKKGCKARRSCSRND